MFPTVVLVQAEINLNERTPFWPFRFADQVQPSLQRCAITLAGITFDAGTDDVFPSGGPAAITGNDVIQIQIFAIKNAPAILAGVFVALKNVVPRELDFLFGQPIKCEQQNHLGNSDFERDGMNAFRMRLALGKMMPLAKIKSLEGTVRALQHHLGVTLEEESQRAPGGADIDRLPEPIKHEHVLV